MMNLHSETLGDLRQLFGDDVTDFLSPLCIGLGDKQGQKQNEMPGHASKPDKNQCPLPAKPSIKCLNDHHKTSYVLV